MSSFKRIKIGDYIFTADKIVYAHKQPDGDVAVNVFSDMHDGIDDVIIKSEAAQKFWEYCLRWKKMVWAEGCLLNTDHITLVRPDSTKKGRLLLWTTFDGVSPFHLCGQEAEEFLKAYASDRHCIDLNDYSPSRCSLPSFKRPRQTSDSK